MAPNRQFAATQLNSAHVDLCIHMESTQVRSANSRLNIKSFHYKIEARDERRVGIG
jgi:hypothetical protein